MNVMYAENKDTIDPDTSSINAFAIIKPNIDDKLGRFTQEKAAYILGIDYLDLKKLDEKGFGPDLTYWKLSLGHNYSSSALKNFLNNNRKTKITEQKPRISVLQRVLYVSVNNNKRFGRHQFRNRDKAIHFANKIAKIICLKIDSFDPITDHLINNWKLRRKISTESYYLLYLLPMYFPKVCHTDTVWFSSDDVKKLLSAVGEEKIRW